MKQLISVKRSNGNHWVGDGFPVRNIFNYNDMAEELSPFLLLDYAGPADFSPTTEQRGVGAHPHRGFETVTIVYHGSVSHRDSAGAGGTIGPGDVQWMTAGSGLLHEEFHSPDFARQGGRFELVQLWVNLPAKDKMTPPAYQALPAADIPIVPLPGGVGKARILAGQLGDAVGPARTFTPINVWDLQLTSGGRVELDLPEGYTTMALVLHGSLRFGEHDTVGSGELAVLERDGTRLAFEVQEEAIVLLLNGQPIHEPVVGQGPFVMNTREEILQAVLDYRSGRFGNMA